MQKHLLTAALAMSLLGGTSALAQDYHHDHGDNRGGGQPQAQARGPAPTTPPAYQQGQGRGQNQGRTQGFVQPQGQANRSTYTRAYGQTQVQPQAQYQGRGQGSGYNASRYSGQFQNQPQYQNQQQGSGRPQTNRYAGQQDQYRGQGYDREAFRGGGQYEQRGFQRQFYAPERVRWEGQWNRPRNYYYRQWAFGDYLPFGWFTEQYWIDDYDSYGLEPAPNGYAWVREGGDAVLVDVYTGQVVEVEYGLFY